MSWSWKIGSDFVHLWVKFSNENVVLIVSRSKNSKIFTCAFFFLCIFYKMFIHKTFPALKHFWLIIMKVMMIITNCFCGMVDRQKACTPYFQPGLFQRFSPSQISDTPRERLNLSSDVVEWSCIAMITTTPWRHYYSYDYCFVNLIIYCQSTSAYHNISLLLDCLEACQSVLIGNTRLLAFSFIKDIT